MNLDITKAYESLDRNYTISALYHLNEDNKIVLKDSEEYHCRFCGQTKDKTHFKKKAHVLSRFIGNTKLFSTYECDECNERVFSPIESSFAEYMKLFHTMTRVSGYRGVPSYKPDMQGKSRIDVEQGELSIKAFEGEAPIVEIDEDNHSVVVKGRRSYVPQNVFKALVKMAVSIMPESELVNIPETLNWLQGKKIVGKFIANFRMYGGMNRLPFITALLMKRKENHTDKVPAYIFMLAYDYFAFTIPIPFCELDRCYIGEDISMTVIPTPFDFHSSPITYKWIDFSSPDKVSNEQCSVSMHFERMEQRDIRDVEEK